MRWVTAIQLETWARSVASRNELPKIVADLIRASSPDIASMRFPSGDKGQVRGFDGHLVSEVGAFNVPQGRSYWEFGTTPDYKEKAESDFKKRTEEVACAEQQDTTFVFVSPWTWDSSDPKNKLENWITARKKASSWKDVRYIDGMQLETWLEQCPAVSAWHARTTLHLQPAEGIRSTDEFWDDFAGQFGPPITEDVLVCERDRVAQQLVQDLLRPSSSVSLIADSPNEVVAFAIAAIRKASPEIRLYLEARTLVVDSVAAGRLLTGENLVLLLRNDAARSPGQFSSRGSILVPLGRQQRGAGTATLPRPTGYAMGTALRTMNIDENRALTLARGSGRSLAALARLIPSGSYEQPAWVAKGQDLLPAILAGAWDTANEPDREVVEQIASVSWAEIEKRLRAFLPDGDPPFDLEGTVWKVRAPMDAFVRVGPFIGQQEAALLHAAMLRVFSAIEPEPDPNDVVGFSRPNPTGYSDWLREGLATTLLLFAVWSEPADINLGGETGQAFANRVLGELPGLKSDYRLLTSLRNELPLLAEAAPDPLLSALELMLEGNGDLIRPVFQEKAGWIFPTSDHTGLLWALETLAWDPAYFRRAVLILARLAAIDPGGRLSNRPGNSLAEIFVLWNPNTNAPPAERLAVLDEIAKTCPGVGWALLLALLPTTHGTSTPTAKPKLREAGAADRPPVTYKELWESQAAVCQRAIGLAGHDPNRWVELVNPISRFAPAERTQAIAALDATLAPLAEDRRKKLWTKLRDEVARQERFKDAAWALPEEELAPLRALADKYAPTDPVTNLVALFDSSDYDDATDRARAAERRSTAIKDLHADGGAEAILRLAAEIRAPYWIAEAAAGAGLTAAQINELLALALDRDADTSFIVALSSIYRNLAGPERGEHWMREVARKPVSPEVLAKLFLGWPDGLGTWAAVRRFGGDVMQTYWLQRSPLYLKGSRRELLEALLMFLRYGRAVEAIQSSLDRLTEVPTELAFRMLDGVIPQLNARATAADTMTAFYVEKLLEQLDRRADVSDEQLAHREFRLLPLLEHSGRQLRIYRLMAADPEFYHSILRNVFLGKGEEKREVDEQTQAAARLSYSLLSHFSLLPGQSGTDIDAAALSRWIDEMRRLGAETDRVQITDNYVGHVLAHAPPDPDGAWPHRAVRGEIERLASTDVERAIQIERFNMRGVHSRNMYQGGNEERNFARAAYDAAQSASAWPRTAALLRAIGKTWEEDAVRADVDAAQRRLKS